MLTSSIRDFSPDQPFNALLELRTLAFSTSASLLSGYSKTLLSLEGIQTKLQS